MRKSYGGFVKRVLDWRVLRFSCEGLGVLLVGTECPIVTSLRSRSVCRVAAGCAFRSRSGEAAYYRGLNSYHYYSRGSVL